MRFALCPVPVALSPNLLLAANDDFVNMNPNVVGVFNVLANDTDPNGDALTVTVVSAPLHGTVIILLSDELQYKPVANYARQDILTYAISDGKGGSATANIVIRITNRSPIALPDIATTFVNAPVIITVLVNDTEPDSQPLSVMGATVPVHGTVLINANGTIRYTPTSGSRAWMRLTTRLTIVSAVYPLQALPSLSLTAFQWLPMMLQPRSSTPL